MYFYYLAYPMMRDPKTEPIPAPDPATPTVAAPAPMNLAAESMSLLAELVWRLLTPAETEGAVRRTMETREAATRAMADIVGICWSEMLNVLHQVTNCHQVSNIKTKSLIIKSKTQITTRRPSSSKRAP